MLMSIRWQKLAFRNEMRLAALSFQETVRNDKFYNKFTELAVTHKLLKTIDDIFMLIRPRIRHKWPVLCVQICFYFRA
jgi:hypothetical protein